MQTLNTPMVPFGAFARIPMELYEAYGDTAFYTWRLVAPDSVSELHAFASGLIDAGMIPSVPMIPDLHMSVVRCENAVPLYTPDTTRIQVRPLRWEILGRGDCFFLALITELHPRVDTQMKRAHQQGGQFVFSSYLPHISVLKFDTKEIPVAGLPVPGFLIDLESEEPVPFRCPTRGAASSSRAHAPGDMTLPGGSFPPL